ncbi:acetate/propionate family kinase [Pseudodesulfovibrio sp. JC047]|uniref:acetate kinase n=1 Tax=Pseudodesulfovibrio sp. JC047 TaxID=2683199 RepID=UPI0013D731F7|nr:acetate kinase [Pseudodesulfovibrio sp. JC047]NDV18598.1 acetate/propionate family kinase [Pseudodesulfovibrio sp. JC047]
MNILVINCGSSSLKYQLLNMKDDTVIASGVIERIGEELGIITQRSNPAKWPDTKSTEKLFIRNHEAAMRLMVEKLVGEEWGVIESLKDIDAIGHRVVQGGETFSTPELVDENVIEEIRANIPLAPLHAPNLTGIEIAMELFPHTPQVTVFDTEFHQTIPKKAFMYPIPLNLYKELKIRKYGFHGTSHKYVTKRAATHLGKPMGKTNLITIHLGNGCSMAAVKNGQCADTTMGLTPLAGLMMGTRCGDVDPAILAFIAKHKKMGIEDIDTMLNKKSGLYGICGTNDMRDIHAARENGDANAQLAFEMFAYRVKLFIGAYLAVLGTIDAVVFTAGIGENDAHVRALACKGLEPLGITIDQEKNTLREPGTRTISADDSPISILIVPTNEELEIAKETMALVNG